MKAYLYFPAAGIAAFFVDYACTKYVFKMAGFDEFLFWFGIFVVLNAALAIVLRRKKCEGVSLHVSSVLFYVLFSVGKLHIVPVLPCSVS